MAEKASIEQKFRRLRLQPLQPSALPPHPTLASQQQSAESVDLKKFIYEILSEAVEFSDSVIPSTFQQRGSPKASPPSTAKVQLFSSSLIAGEAWFARQSVHENAPLEGTADHEEFENGLFHNHSVNERDYTPSCYEAFKVLDYSGQIAELGHEVGPEAQFENVAMEIYEMVHQIPAPLNNRVFSTLVVRAKTRAQSFVVAQVPIDLRKVPQAMYSNGRNRTDADTPLKKTKVVIGQYTSIERVKDQGDGDIMWEMAVASDAKGFVPMSVQKMGIPGAIAKDVGFFMKWAADGRKAAA